MEKEIKNIVKKTAKIAGVTCVAMGAVALVTSKAALKAMLKGGEYLKDTVKKIIDEEPEEKENPEETTVEEAAPEEPVAAEEDFAEEENI